MNYWTELSVEYANQRSYLDDLFAVYPLAPEGIRQLDEERWESIQTAFHDRNDAALIGRLLDLELFPIKDSYVAFLKRDRSSIQRNPRTVHRLCGRLYEMGLDQIYAKCSEPKETNRQIGPLFRRWLAKGSLGLPPLNSEDFSESEQDAVMMGSDQQLKDFATERLGYRGQKGVDLIARVQGRYVVGEAKFLTDFGGHQNAQFQDAIQLLKHSSPQAVSIAVLDGVLFLRNRGKMYAQLAQYAEHPILSALLLRDFLFSL